MRESDARRRELGLRPGEDEEEAVLHRQITTTPTGLRGQGDFEDACKKNVEEKQFQNIMKKNDRPKANFLPF